MRTAPCIQSERQWPAEERGTLLVHVDMHKAGEGAKQANKARAPAALCLHTRVS